MKKTLLLIILCIAVTMPSCKYFKERGWFGGKSDTLEVWQARQDSLKVADSLKQALLLQQERQRQQAIADSLNRVEQERLDYEARFRYHIIVGSFVTPEYAVAFEEHIRNLGYNAQKMDLPGSRFEMISAEAHETLSDAYRRLEHFQETIAIDSWIYAK